MDWWELPTADLLSVLKRTGRIKVEIKDRNGTLGFMKMNNLQPPFDNAAIRRALLGAVVQSDYMTAIAGEDRSMWRDDVGIFTPGTDMASDAGMEVLTGPRDMARVRAAIKEAGYNNEKTVLLAPSDPHYRKAMADVGAGMLKDAGFNLDVQSLDWGTAIVRRESKQPVDKGGWSALFTTANGLDMQTPLLHFLRTTGEKAWFGWTNSAAHRGTARRLGRCARSRRAEADRRRHPAPVLDRRAASAGRHLVSADGVAEHDRRHSRRLPAVLGRSPGVNRVSMAVAEMTGDDQPPNSSRSTACRSFESKNFAAHLSSVPRNQPAATAACCCDAAGFAPLLPFAPVAARSRKSK